VDQFINRTLASLIQHYLPNSHSQGISSLGTSVPVDSSTLHALTATELHENKYRVISYGFSLNVYEEQLLGTQRLSRCGLPAPEITTLETAGWINQEPTRLIQMRLVAELTRRIGLEPEEVDIPFLIRKLKADIPVEDLAKDRKRKILPSLRDDDAVLESIRLSSKSNQDYRRPKVSRRKLPLQNRYDTLRHGAPSITREQFVRSALESRHSKSDTPPDPAPSPDTSSEMPPPLDSLEKHADSPEESRPVPSITTSVQPLDVASESPIVSILSEEPEEAVEGDREMLKPPPKLLQETIKWSTSADFYFVPISATKRRSVVVSPLELQDEEYLGDPSGAGTQKEEILNSNRNAVSKEIDG
jgi:hypothetical protein